MEPSVNRNALEIVSGILDRKDELNCEVTDLPCGTTVIDAGIKTEGSSELGLQIGEVAMGGLGVARLSTMHMGEIDLPAVIVASDNSLIATLGSQYSGWTIKVGKYFAMGSGPARALARVEKDLYEHIQYEDDHHAGVIVLESREEPNDEVAEYIAKKCGIAPSDLTCIVVPTASKAGSVQISARIVEVGVHKMYKLGFDLLSLRGGYGIAPVAPVAKNDAKAMGVTNDCILYGGRTFYFLRYEIENMEEKVKMIPSCSSPQYGEPFYNIFKSVNWDFYEVDGHLFSPAEVTVSHLESKTIYKAGRLNPKVLKKSLGIK
jgi:methenyltetrahydromethanopterin cyclohydrolase